MEDAALIERRLDVLRSLNAKLSLDISNSQKAISLNETEIEELVQAAKVLERLKSARGKRSEPRIPEPPANSEQQGTTKTSIPDMILQVLRAEDRPMRPVEIKKAIEIEQRIVTGDKHVAGECNRLHKEGRLLKDPITPEYSLPPDLDRVVGQADGSEDAKGRQAVPGGHG